MSKGMSAYVFRAPIEVEVTEDFIALATSRELTPELLAQMLCDTACESPLQRAKAGAERAKIIRLPSDVEGSWITE